MEFPEIVVVPPGWELKTIGYRDTKERINPIMARVAKDTIPALLKIAGLLDCHG